MRAFSAMLMPLLLTASATAQEAEVADNPGAGVTSLNGEMLDRPHLERAKRVLSRAPKA